MPRLAEHGLRIEAISQDSPDLVLYLKAREGLDLTIYGDPKLVAIKALRLVMEGGRIYLSWTLLGIPLGLPTIRRQLPIPATILIDEYGIVRRYDVATDLRLRGDDARILKAVETVFGSD